MSVSTNLPTVVSGAIQTVASPAALPVSEVAGAERYSISDTTVYVFDGTSWTALAGGGTGTVTSVSVTTANGVSGTVANPTTTPAITLTLGAITPSSVAATGTVTGSNLSGTNTGDQTITLTSDVTGSGTGSITATVASVGGSSAVNVHSAELAANAATSANTASTIVKRDSSGDFSAGTITASLTGHASADLALAGGTMSGAIDMGSNKITSLASGTTSGDALEWGQIGAANGIAPLDGSGKVPYANLPSALMTYKGAWDASTNTPTLADGTGLNGDTYRASVAGTQDLGSGPQTWAVGDFAIYNGTIWQHSPAADGVSSVNGFTGDVVLTQADITGTVAIANGGTGQTTANSAFNALAPSQATHAGQFLTTDGSNTSWAAVSSGVTTMDPFGTTPNANGATITGTHLELEPADATHPGGLSTSAQTIAGTKTFADGVAVSTVGGQGTITNFIDWTDFSGSVTMFYSGNGPSTISVSYCEYMQINKTTFFRFSITVTSRVFTSSSDILEISLPFTAATANPQDLPGGNWLNTGDVKSWPIGLNLSLDASNPSIRTSRAAGGTAQAELINVTAQNSNDGDTYEGFFTYKSV